MKQKILRKNKKITIKLFPIILLIMLIGIVIIIMKKSNNEMFVTSKQTQKATAPSTLLSEMDSSQDISDSGNGSVRASLEGDTLTITGTGRMKNWSNDSNPPWANDKKIIKNVVISEGITNIGANAFTNCIAIEKVTIANSVTAIGDSAFFNCSKLENVNIPESVNKIGESAFESCSKLRNIDISDNVSIIGKNAFAANSLLEAINVASGNQNYSSKEGVLFNKGKTILITYPVGKQDLFYIIPPTVEHVQEYAFWDCAFLKKLIILSTVSSIEKEGIIQTENKISLYLEADTEAERYAKNKNWRYVTVKNTWDVSENRDKTIFAMLTEDGTLDITGKGRTKDWEDSVSTPWTNNVDIRKNIKKIVISDGITYIGENTCANLHEATSLTIPNSVTIIERAAFFNCSKLTDINLPANIKKLGISVFASCDGIIEINIPASVSELGNDAINGRSLQRIKVDDQNTTYSDKDGVLFNKNKTTLITYPSGKMDRTYEIPSTVDTIGRLAFYNSMELRHIIVPDSINSINEDTFSMNNKLRIITIPDTISNIHRNAISNSKDVYIVTENENAYAETYATAYAKGYNVGKGWDISASSEDDVVALYNGKENMLYIRGSGCMQDWEPNTGVFSEIESEDSISVTLDNQIENIGNYAFEGCTALNRILIERTVTSIGDNAFKDCSENLMIITDNDNTVAAQYARSNNINYKVKEFRGVAVTPQTAIIEVGRTQKLTAAVEPENTYYNRIKWSSSDENIATVTNEGIVTGKKEGQAIITVTSLSDESKTATATITVEPNTIAVTGVTVEPQTAIIEVGGTQKLTAMVTPENATNKEVEWSSDDENIATVTSVGIVTGKKEGQVIITAISKADRSKVATATVTIKEDTSPLPDDNQKPKIEKIEIINKNGKQYIYITATDAKSEIENVEVKKGDKTYQVKKDEDGRYYFIPDEEGNYTIKIVNEAGYTLTETYQYEKSDEQDKEKPPIGDIEDIENDKKDTDKTNKTPYKGRNESIKGEDSTKATMPIPKAGILAITIRVLIGISLLGLIITSIKVKKYKDI